MSERDYLMVKVDKAMASPKVIAGRLRPVHRIEKPPTLLGLAEGDDLVAPIGGRTAGNLKRVLRGKAPKMPVQVPTAVGSVKIPKNRFQHPKYGPDWRTPSGSWRASRDIPSARG